MTNFDHGQGVYAQITLIGETDRAKSRSEGRNSGLVLKVNVLAFFSSLQYTRLPATVVRRQRAGDGTVLYTCYLEPGD